MSHLAALSRVVFDLGVFPRVARQRLRRTLVYLLLLVTLSAAATTASLTLKLRDLVHRLEPHLDEIPTITIKNGQASADVEQPWVKRLGRDDGHDLVLIIDTTGRRTDFAPDEVGLFLQRTRLIIKKQGELRLIGLDRVPDMTFGPDIAREVLAKLMHRVPFYLGAALFAYFLFVKSIQALVLVLAALIGASRRRVALGFGPLFSIAVYALTPAVLLDCALPFVKLELPMFWLVYAALGVAYAILGAQRATAADPPDSTLAL